MAKEMAKQLPYLVAVPGNALQATHLWKDRLLTEPEAHRVNSPAGYGRIDCVHGVSCDEACVACASLDARGYAAYLMEAGMMASPGTAPTNDEILKEYERRKLTSPVHMKSIQRCSSLERELAEERRRAESLGDMLDGYVKLADAFGKPKGQMTRDFIEASLRELKVISEGVKQKQLTGALAKAMLGPVSFPERKWFNATEGVACQHRYIMGGVDGLYCQDCRAPVPPPFPRQVVKVASIETPPCDVVVPRSSLPASNARPGPTPRFAPRSGAEMDEHRRLNRRDMYESGPGIERLPKPVDEGQWVLDVDCLCADE